MYGDIKDYHDLNIAELKSIKKCLQGIEGDTLELFLMKMCECYKKGNNNIRTIIKAVLDLEEITDNYITGYFMQTLEQKNMQENEGEEDENDFELSVCGYEKNWMIEKRSTAWSELRGCFL